jgi:asparagine synthetase B (glutamine-hydrolysing)
MCGIGGFYRYGDTPIDIDQIKALLCQLERRGNHATGIALQDEKGEVFVCKAPTPAWNFAAGKEFEVFMTKYFNERTRIALLHTRAATIGNPNKNENNHPMFAGKAAIVHNGSINNHSYWFSQNKDWERKAETDSDVIRAVVDELGITPEAIRYLSRFSGSAAIMAVSPEYPGKLLVGRSGKPLTMGWNEKEQMLAFASEKEMLYHATKPLKVALGFVFAGNRNDYMYFTIPADTMYIVGEKGKEFHDNLRIASYTTGEMVYRCNETYHETKKRFDRETPPPKREVVTVDEGPLYVNSKLDVVRCRNTKCNNLMELDEKLKKEPLWELACDKCGTYLMEEPKKA